MVIASGIENLQIEVFLIEMKAINAGGILIMCQTLLLSTENVHFLFILFIFRRISMKKYYLHSIGEEKG